MRRSFLLFLVLAACSSSSSDSTADAGHGDGGPTDGGSEAGTGDDGGDFDAGPTIVMQGGSCGANRICATGLYCKFGTGPTMFVGTCQPQLKEGDACVVDSPAGKVDGGGCGPGLVCDVGLNMCVKKT